MKNKKISIFILVILMATVWGLIIYRIADGVNQPETFQAIKKNDISPTNIIKTKKNYSLNLNYSDPFKTSNSRQRRPQKTQNPTIQNAPSSNTSKQNLKVNNSTVWPTISYHGLVKSSNNKQVGLLKVNSRSFLVSKGQKFSEVKVINYSTDEINLQYNGEMKTYKK